MYSGQIGFIILVPDLGATIVVVLVNYSIQSLKFYIRSYWFLKDTHDLKFVRLDPGYCY